MIKNLSGKNILNIILVFAVGLFFYVLNKTLMIYALVYLLINKLVPLTEFFIPLMIFVLLVVGIFIFLSKKSSQVAKGYLVVLFFILSFLANQFKFTSYTFLTKDAILAEKTLEIIANKAIDILPTELKYIKQNNLSWQPRPNPFNNINNFSSDLANANFLQDNKAPEFVLLNKINFEKNMSFINEQPQLIYQLLNHYVPIEETEQYILYKKSSKPNLPLKKIVTDENIVIDEWVDVPDEINALIQLKILPQHTVVGEFLNNLGFVSKLSISYKLSDGTILPQEISPNALADVIFVSPYLSSLSQLSNSLRVKQIKINIKNNALYEKTIPCAWVIIPTENLK